MTGTLVLTGSGLLLLAPTRPACGRLAWLVGRRLPPAASRRGRSGISFRIKVIWISLAVGLGLGLVAGPLPGALAAVVSGVVGWGWRQLTAERAEAEDQVRMADVVSALAAEHAAGATLAVALGQSATGAGRWQPVMMQASRLASVGLEPAGGLVREPLLVPLAVALALAGRTGAGVTDVLARVRADVVAAQDCRRAVAEAVAGPRSSAVLLAVLPVIGVAMGVALGARPGHVLTGTPIGLVVLTLGVLLDLAGLIWTLRLTR